MRPNAVTRPPPASPHIVKRESSELPETELRQYYVVSKYCSALARGLRLVLRGAGRSGQVQLLLLRLDALEATAAHRRHHARVGQRQVGGRRHREGVGRLARVLPEGGGGAEEGGVEQPWY